MKQVLTLFAATLLLLSIPNVLSAVGTKANSLPEVTSLEKSKVEAKKEWKELSRQERSAKKQEVKNAVKAYKAGEMSENTLLLVIITILLPPLGMYLYEGEINGRFWLSLLLTILFYLPGLIYTLVIILGEK